MASRKRGAVEGEGETALSRTPCEHIADFKSKRGGPKAFKELQNAAIFNIEGAKRAIKCVMCGVTRGRLYACLVCANVCCLGSFTVSSSLSTDLPHALVHARLYPDHSLAVDLHRAELFCCICADQVYDADFDRVVIHSQSLALKCTPKRLINGMQTELATNKRITRSNNRRMKNGYHLADHAAQCETEADGSSLFPWGLRGLNNLGNTCYLNCILQALIHVGPLKNFFLNGGHTHNSCKNKNLRSCLGCEMHKIYSAAFSGDHSPYSPAQFLYSWWQHAVNLAGYKQQDAHEFFIALVNGFHSSLSKSVPDGKCKSAGDEDCKCIAHQTFSGLLQSDVSCTVCGFNSTAHDPCIDISLDLEPSLPSANTVVSNCCAGVRSSKEAETRSGMKVGATLYGCLDRFTRLERLGIGEKYYCQNCKVPQDSVKQMSIRKLPLVLCFHIKRFEHSSSSNVSRKVDRYMQFPFSLNMAPFLSSSLMRLQHGNRILTEHDQYVPEATEFELLAVVTHTGNLDSGHYITYLHLGGLWYRCDDPWVFKESEEVVRACQAYMLFYVRKYHANTD